jgi:hypothetical protein
MILNLIIKKNEFVTQFYREREPFFKTNELSDCNIYKGVHLTSDKENHLLLPVPNE